MNWKLMALAPVFIGLVTAHLLAAPPKPAFKPAPEIFSLDPSEGKSGQEIDLKGSALSETKHVYFCVGTAIRDARFKVVSDTELKVTAPTFLRPAAAATVVVQTTWGVTVGMPASSLAVDNIVSNGGGKATFYHVTKNGVLTKPMGIVLIEEGGASEAPHGAGLCFVRNGGSLLNMDHFRGMIFHEPLAQGCIDTRRSRYYPIALISANQITASVGIEQFLYTPSDNPNIPAKTAPKVTSVTPLKATPGSLITLHGHGFLGTSAVYVVDHHHLGSSSPGFRVVADNQLEIDLDERTNGVPLLVVVNPKGTTVVLSESHLTGVQPDGRMVLDAVQVVKPGEVYSKGGGSRTFLVESGGILARTGGSCTIFVQQGGRMSLNSGGGGITVFCEDESDVERNNSGGGGNVVKEVSPLSLSILKAPLEIGYR